MTRDSRRRNRNIGTKKSGYKKPGVLGATLEHPNKDELKNFELFEVHDRIVSFSADNLSPGYVHPCSYEDVVAILLQLPAEDVRGIDHVHFQQYGRKRNAYRPIWGSLGCYKEYPGFSPTSKLSLNAQRNPWEFRCPRSIDAGFLEEMERTKAYATKHWDTKRHHHFVFDAAACRLYQLENVIPHEVGHWVDRLRSGQLYFKKSWGEVERFADRYSVEASIKAPLASAILSEPHTSTE
jgi:hypothetical protein